MLKSKEAITLRLQLCSTHYYALQTCKRILCLNLVTKKVQVKNHKEVVVCAPIINHALKSEVDITFYLQLCSARYTALEINNRAKNVSVMNPCRFRKCQWEGISQHHKSQPCTISEKNWRTNNCSTMMLAMQLLRLAKRHVSE